MDARVKPAHDKGERTRGQLARTEVQKLFIAERPHRLPVKPGNDE
jgi:hypothetical protein